MFAAAAVSSGAFLLGDEPKPSGRAEVINLSAASRRRCWRAIGPQWPADIWSRGGALAADRYAI